MQENLILTTINPEDLIQRIAQATRDLLQKEQPAETTEKEFVSPLEGSDYLGVDPSTLHRWHVSGKIQKYGIGSKRYYKKSDLQKLLTPVKQ